MFTAREIMEARKPKPPTPPTPPPPSPPPANPKPISNWAPAQANHDAWTITDDQWTALIRTLWRILEQQRAHNG